MLNRIKLKNKPPEPSIEKPSHYAADPKNRPEKINPNRNVMQSNIELAPAIFEKKKTLTATFFLMSVFLNIYFIEQPLCIRSTLGAKRASSYAATGVLTLTPPGGRLVEYSPRF